MAIIRVDSSNKVHITPDHIIPNMPDDNIPDLTQILQQMPSNLPEILDENITDLSKIPQELPEWVLEDMNTLIRTAASLLPSAAFRFDHWGPIRSVSVDIGPMWITLSVGPPLGYRLMLDCGNLKLLDIVYAKATHSWEGENYDRWHLPALNELLLLIQMDVFNGQDQWERQGRAELYSPEEALYSDNEP